MAAAHLQSWKKHRLIDNALFCNPQINGVIPNEWPIVNSSQLRNEFETCMKLWLWALVRSDRWISNKSVQWLTSVCLCYFSILSYFVNKCSNCFNKSLALINICFLLWWLRKPQKTDSIVWTFLFNNPSITPPWAI